MKKRILVICPAPEHVYPSQRLKYEQYFNHWRENDYEITVAPFMTHKLWNILYKKSHYLTKIILTVYGYLRRIKDVFRAANYDLIYIHLWVTPFGSSLFEYLVKITNPHIVYDIDDAVFQGHKSKMNAFIAFLKGKKKIFTLMKIAKHVIVCTDYLENEARKHNQNVTNISSTFDTERFTPLKSYKQTDEIALGWTGSHSTMAFLHLLDNVLIEVAKKRKVKLISICDRDFELEGIKIENIRWTENNEVSDLHKIQIGLYPTPKEDWVLGKSGLKALTYQSCAIPLVATAFGSNLRNIDNEINGFLANSEDEWINAIIKLIDSEELREKIGKNGRDNVVKRFSLDANKKTYLEILNRVVKTKKSA